MRFAIGVFLLLALSGCDSGLSGDPDASSERDAGADAGLRPDAEVTADAGPQSCALKDPGPISISEGSRFQLDLETVPGGGTISVRDRPLGTTVTLEGAHLKVRAPYGSLGPAAVALDLRCGTATATAAISYELRPIRWRSLPAWSGVEGPDAREHPALFIDPNQADHLYLFGGFGFVPRQFSPRFDLWRYDLSADRWTRTATRGGGLPGLANRIAVDPLRKRVLSYGGAEATGAAKASVVRVETTTTPANLVAIGATGPAPAGVLHGFVFDAGNDRYLRICGSSDLGADCALSTFTPEEGTDDGGWAPLAASGDLPDGRYGHAYAYDAENQRAIVWSGARDPDGISAVNPAEDAWALTLSTTPPTWTKLAPSGDLPPGRRNFAFAFDPEGLRLFIWGGTPDARTTSPGLWVLSLDPGAESWTRLDRPDEPAIRSSNVGIYDAKRHRILMGFGNTMSGRYADLHALEL